MSRQPVRGIVEFLDKHLPPHVASLQLDSYAFPAQCAVSDHGDYPSRFTLRKAQIWENMQKVGSCLQKCTSLQKSKGRYQMQSHSS